jgi:hypothetical protein
VDLTKLIIGAAIAGAFIYLYKQNKQPVTPKTRINNAMGGTIDFLNNSYLNTPQP